MGCRGRAGWSCRALQGDWGASTRRPGPLCPGPGSSGLQTDDAVVLDGVERCLTARNAACRMRHCLPKGWRRDSRLSAACATACRHTALPRSQNGGRITAASDSDRGGPHIRTQRRPRPAAAAALLINAADARPPAHAVSRRGARRRSPTRAAAAAAAKRAGARRQSALRAGSSAGRWALYSCAGPRACALGPAFLCWVLCPNQQPAPPAQRHTSAALTEASSRPGTGLYP